MIATVDQSQVVLEILAVTQNGQLSSDIVSGNVRVYTVDIGVQTDILVSTPLVNITSSFWSYEWEPVSLSAGQYFIEYSLTDTLSDVTYAIENLFVINDVSVAQAAIQSDIADVQTDVTAIQTDITNVQTDVTAIQTDATAIRQIESGRWEITSDNQMIIYDADGTTPLLTFNLLDANGDPTTQNPFQRVPV